MVDAYLYGIDSGQGHTIGNQCDNQTNIIISIITQLHQYFDQYVRQRPVRVAFTFRKQQIAV